MIRCGHGQGFLAVLMSINTPRLVAVSRLVNTVGWVYDGLMTTPDTQLELLKALADPARLAIVRQLAADGEVCACDFTECCAVSQPTVSHHLRVLRAAGVVATTRIGNQIRYRLAPDIAHRLGGIAAALGS